MGRASRPQGSTLTGSGMRGEDSVPGGEGTSLLQAEEMLEQMEAPEEYLEGFERARRHLDTISGDPRRSREAEVVRTQIMASYVNIADNIYADGDPLAEAFVREVEEISAPLMEEARELARGIDTSDWSSHDFLFYRLYAQARESFDKIDSGNADAIRAYLGESNKGQDPLLGGAGFSAVDYRKQALLLHGACVVEEDAVMRDMDRAIRAREDEIRERARVAGRVPGNHIISLPRTEWSAEEGGAAGFAAVEMVPEEADALLMDQEPAAMGMTSAGDHGAPALVLLGAIESTRKEGRDYDPAEIAIHELIHTSQPNSIEAQRQLRETLEERGIDPSRSTRLHSLWLEANTEMLRLLRGNPGLAENLGRLSEVQFAYPEEVRAVAKVLEKLPPEKRLGWVERFNALGPAGSLEALRSEFEDPLMMWDKLAEEASEQRRARRQREALLRGKKQASAGRVAS